MEWEWRKIITPPGLFTHDWTLKLIPIQVVYEPCFSLISCPCHYFCDEKDSLKKKQTHLTPRKSHQSFLPTLNFKIWHKPPVFLCSVGSMNTQCGQSVCPCLPLCAYDIHKAFWYFLTLSSAPTLILAIPLTRSQFHSIRLSSILSFVSQSILKPTMTDPNVVYYRFYNQNSGKFSFS